MNTLITKSTVKIPLDITYRGRHHKAEVVGRIHPFNKYFTCRIPGENMLIMEAIYNERSRGYTWKTKDDHTFAYLTSLIGKEIEKYFS